MIKKFILPSLVSATLLISSCASDPINTVELQNNNTVAQVNVEAEEDYVKAQSLFGEKKGKVPDNGDVNIKIDNLILARRTFNNSVPVMHIDGKDAYAAMNKMIDNAQKSLYIETFIFHDDETGRKMAERIARKRKQGVDVKVLIDGLGLRVTKDTRIADYLKNEGVDVKIYNKLILGVHGINITHRKLIIADGENGITGGMNFGNEYEKEWHDSMTEFHGEVVQDMQKEFLVDWKRAGGETPKSIQTLKAGKTYGNVPMRVTVTSAHESDKRYQIKHSLLTLIDNAKKKITVEGAYFSDDNLIKTLLNASKRGVDVQVIMPQKGDSKHFNRINPATAKIMLENGIKVYFYQPRFTHMKAALIDNFAVIGSANPDARSFRENQELNVISESPEFVKDLETRLIAVDIKSSKAQDVRTVQQGGLGTKIAQTIYEIFDYYL